MKRIAINGFGRIGRLTLRQLRKNENLKIVAINDLTDAATLAHLLKYDSVQGGMKEEITSEEGALYLDSEKIEHFSEKDPENLPWKKLEVDLVIECTGMFRTRKALQKHLDAGARKVLLSAPAKDDIKTIVLGVNDHIIQPDDLMLSNASCTTNCLAPMAKVLHDSFTIKRGYMTTTHAYTATQNLLDGAHKDLRRARAAALSIIPTSTGAAKALGLVMPELDGKLDGFAMRVPTPTGSVVDLTALLDGAPDTEEINRVMKVAANGPMKGILEYTAAPIVSADVVGHPASCIFDSGLTSVQDNLVKVVGWYDNEMGYAARLADMAHLMA